MKIAILGDTHWGCRNGNNRIRQSQIRFFKEQFFPYLKENGITDVIQLGDFFDNRKHIDILSLSDCITHFIQPCVDQELDVKVIIGNHDLPYKTNNQDASSASVLGAYPETFTCIENELTEIDGIHYCPWISPANEEDLLEGLRKGGRLLMGHFETTNMLMGKNNPCDHGTTEEGDFQGWELVLSGHFHHRSRTGNIFYTGTPYETSFSDADQVKGFHILDTETLEMEFIANDKKLFHDIVYSTDDEIPNVEHVTNDYVRLKIVKNDDPEKVATLQKRINAAGPIDLKIIDRTIEAYTSANVDSVIESQSTELIIKEYVDEVAGDNTLHKEVMALTLEIYEQARQNMMEQ